MPLKVELHAHSSDDPEDRVPYTTVQLIDRAAALGYDALALTLHNLQLDLDPLRRHAETRGIALIPGVERTIEGKHVLLLNFTAQGSAVTSFDALARLRAAEAGLVIAPHPFYPIASSLGPMLERHPALFDAVEINSMYAPGIDFNRRAVRWAASHGKPIVGGGDVHRLAQLGTTYSMIDSAADPRAICEAVRAGRVRVETRPLSWVKSAAIFADLVRAWLWTSLRGPRRAAGESKHSLIQ
jgi:predicted metal-dependent phosphoesterase TrpH